MTTVLTQIAELAQAIEAIAGSAPATHQPELAALAYAFSDAANMAHLPPSASSV